MKCHDLMVSSEKKLFITSIQTKKLFTGPLILFNQLKKLIFMCNCIILFQYTVLNTPAEGLLAINRHEAGLHDKGLDTNRRLDPLCTKWNDSYVDFPEEPVKIGYDGEIENL